jgi:hypothetical protein
VGMRRRWQILYFIEVLILLYFSAHYFFLSDHNIKPDHVHKVALLDV